MIQLGKKPTWNWLKDDDSDEVHHIEWPWDDDDDEVHHIEWPWDDDDDQPDYNDSEEGGADDYASSRPWGLDNDGY